MYLMRRIIKNNLPNKTLLFLLIILAVAAFFRLWQLNQVPPGLYPDVAMNGNNVLESLRTGNFKVFYPENNGREGMMMWLIAFSFLTLGISVWSMKIVAAVVGIITVLGLYLLTKEIFRNTEHDVRHTKYIALLQFFSGDFFLACKFFQNRFPRHLTAFCFGFFFLFFIQRVAH